MTHYKIPHMALRVVRERTITLPLTRASCTDDAASIARHMIGDRPIEFLLAICLDANGNVTGVITLGQGGAHGVAVKVAGGIYSSRANERSVDN